MSEKKDQFFYSPRARIRMRKDCLMNKINQGIQTGTTLYPVLCDLILRYADFSLQTQYMCFEKSKSVREPDSACANPLQLTFFAIPLF